ncbi:hypothetical protein JNW90_30795 [Micromonospora sp. STR1s_5]|nr:hypothetical protein [Micromonospora sp. STR1s_5]
MDERGRLQKRNVRKSLLDSAIASGSVTHANACICHIVSSIRGERTESWEIGKQLTQEQYDKFSFAGDVYALEHVDAGLTKTTLVEKSLYVSAKSVLAP